jgi:magnesium-transporting ATPase (P-type)
LFHAKITLSYSVGHMLNDCDMVRSNESVETMASTTVLCLDKTGTLTENRPYVDRCFMAGVEFDPSDDRALRQLPPSVANIINDAIALNSTAWVNSQYDRVGSAIECALLDFAETRLGCKTRRLRLDHPAERVFPFSSARMRMSTVVKKPTPQTAQQQVPKLKIPSLQLPGAAHAAPVGYTLHIKGAPELILARSVRLMKPDGSIVPMTNEKRMTMGRKIDEWCARGLRVLGFATRDLPKLKNWHEPPEEDLTLTGFIAFVDPVRPNAANAILACRHAGVRATLVSGDNLITATTIARQVGLLRPGFKTGLQSLLATLRNEDVPDEDFVLEGPEFEELDTADLDRVIHRIRVVARASPVDKYRIVERLKSAGEIVAVTGDSPNDEAALRKAEIGLALGSKGSEVAKRASDIVVVDDDITSIMRAIMWGRNVYDNVRKFLQFQLAVAFVVTVTAFVSAVSKYGMPLTSVQMIWINIILDTMAGLALGSEKPTPTLLNRKPYRRRSGLITKAMLRNILGQGVVQSIVILVVLYFGTAIFGLDEKGYDHPTKATTHYTMVFTTVIFFTIFHQINCRRVTEWNIFKSIHANWRFAVTIVFTVIVQIFLVEVCGPFIRTTPLTISQWLWCLGLGATALPIGFAIRFIPIPYEDFERGSSDADSKQLDFLAHRSKREAFAPVFKPLEVDSNLEAVL